MQPTGLCRHGRRDRIETGRLRWYRRRLDLALDYAFSVVIAFLMAVAAVAGLLFQTNVYQADEVLLFGVPTDVVSLVVGLPTLFLRGAASNRRP